MIYLDEQLIPNAEFCLRFIKVDPAMSAKVVFEIGHIASLKSKITPEGFTHEWELYVRGRDSADISNYIEKVVFNLHESFPRPKRGKTTWLHSIYQSYN